MFPCCHIPELASLYPFRLNSLPCTLQFCLISWLEWLLGRLWVLLSILGSLYCLLNACIVTRKSFLLVFYQFGLVNSSFFAISALVLKSQCLAWLVFVSCCRDWDFNGSCCIFTHLFQNKKIIALLDIHLHCFIFTFILHVNESKYLHWFSWDVISV